MIRNIIERIKDWWYLRKMKPYRLTEEEQIRLFGGIPYFLKKDK